MSNEPAEQPVEAPDTRDEPLVEGTGMPDRGKTAIGPLGGLLFVLIGGALAWALIQAREPITANLDKFVDGFGNVKPGMQEEFDAVVQSVGLRNRLLTCGLLGAMLGAVLGVGEGIARRSLKTLLLAAVVGGLVSALFGCAAGLGGHYAMLNRLAVEERLSLTSAVMIECGLWAIMGGGLGLTLGVLTGRVNTTVSCIVAGIAGGALGGVLFPVVAGLLTPAEQLDGIVPATRAARLLWIGIPAAFIGLIVPFAANQKPRKGADQN